MRDSKLETNYQHYLIELFEEMFPGCVVLKNDSGYRQGIQDLIILYGDRYVMLEVKAYEGAPEQPNQAWYVEKFNNWGYSAFIFPENEREVIREVQHALRPRRRARASKP